MRTAVAPRQFFPRWGENWLSANPYLPGVEEATNIPAHKMGRLWKFGLDEIHDWVKSAKTDKSEENGK